MGNVNVSTGLYLIFTKSNFQANIISAKWGGIKRSATDITKMAQSYAQFTPVTVSDAGEITLEIQFNPDQVPPIVSDAEDVYFVFSTGSYWKGTMFVTEYSPEGEVEQMLKSTMKLKLTGEVQASDGTSVLQPVINDVSVICINDDGTVVYGA